MNRYESSCIFCVCLNCHVYNTTKYSTVQLVIYAVQLVIAYNIMYNNAMGGVADTDHGQSRNRFQ